MEENLLLGQLLALVTALCFAQNSIIYRHLGEKLGRSRRPHPHVAALPLVFLLTASRASGFHRLGLHLPHPLASGVIGYFTDP